MKLLVSLILVFVFFGCGVEEGSAERAVFKDGDVIVLESIAGSKITLLRKHGGFVLEGDEDKILLFDIFATYCPPCQKLAPKLMKFQLENSEDVMVISFSHFETVTNQYIIDNFASKFNAYYFIVNSPYNEKIINTVLEDINYKRALQIPFKVVLKGGEYQALTDAHTGSLSNKFYLGEISIDVIKKDIARIIAQ